MQFSPVLQTNRGLVRWSPNGDILASANKSRLTFRDARSLSTLGSHVVEDDIDALVWSPDSEFVAVSLLDLAVVRVFSPHSLDWSARITHGSAGLSKVFFSPDSRHVLTMAQFNVALTIWSLTSRMVKYVKFPRVHAFSGDGRFLAVAEKLDTGEGGRDAVSIYNCEDDFRPLRRFPVRCHSVAGISWRPKSDQFVIWSHSLDFQVLVCNAQGRVEYNYDVELSGLGVVLAKFSPCGQLLVFAGFDRKLRIVNALTMTHVTDMEIQPLISSTGSLTSAVVYEEVENQINSVDDRVVQDWLNIRDTSFRTNTARPLRLMEVPCDCHKPNPPRGISSLEFSPDSSFIALKDRSMPAVLWIVDVQNLQISSVLVFKNSVLSFAWEPHSAKLLILTSNANGSVFLWTPFGAVAFRAGKESEVDTQYDNVSWNAQGKAFCLTADDSFICGKISKSIGQ